jgi:mRNA interferase MazF
MPSTTSFDRGAVVLVPFAYTDQTQVRRRPAVIVSASAYHTARDELIVAALTSNIHRPRLPGEVLLSEWSAAGLAYPSVFTAILQTIRRSMVERVLGQLSASDLRSIGSALAPMLDFQPI